MKDIIIQDFTLKIPIKKDILTLLHHLNMIEIKEKNTNKKILFFFFKHNIHNV